MRKLPLILLLLAHSAVRAEEPADGKFERIPVIGPITSGGVPVTLPPPSPGDVMRALEKADTQETGVLLLYKRSPSKVRVTIEPFADYVDPPRVYPLVGPAQQHHAHYKCTIEPTDPTVEKSARQVIYVDHNHLHVLKSDAEQPATVSVRMFALPRGTIHRLEAEAARDSLARSTLAEIEKVSVECPAVETPFDDRLTKRLESWLDQPDAPLKALLDSKVLTPSKRSVSLPAADETPIIVPAKLGRSEHPFQNGAQIDVLPELLVDGRVKIEARPRWRRLDPSTSVSINGAEVPGVRMFESERSFETKPGQVTAWYWLPEPENRDSPEIVTLITVNVK